MGRWLICIGLVITLAADFWMFRAELAITGLKYFIESGRDVSPNQEIPWQQGPDSPIAPPAERPPNIVLILADDKGNSYITRRRIAEKNQARDCEPDG
ncbi:MAG: hypothetical protein VB957_09620 [Pseudomonadales bacterium]